MRRCRALIFFFLIAVSVAVRGQDAAIELIELPVGKLTFEARAAGPKGGELILLLHGFPQCSYAFRHQLTWLGSLGYRAVAPDQRGYSPGARPAAVEAYGLGDLVGDVLGIADALGEERFHLVGHDWGGAVAWAVAAEHPDRVASLTVLSTPHPRALGRALADPEGEQAERSSYFGDFAADGAEARFLAAKAAFLRQILETPGIGPDDLEIYLDVLGTEEALRGALNWYRAMVRRVGTPPVGLGNPIQVPTLYLWGTEDGAFSRAAAEGSAELVAAPYVFHALPGVGHWLAEDATLEVNRLLSAHLEAWRATPDSSKITTGARHERTKARVATLTTDQPLLSNGRLGGVSVAPDGGLFVSNFGRTLWRVDADGHVTVVDRSLQGASGNAVGPDGSLYQASFVDGRIVRVRPDGKIENWVNSGLDGPVGLAVGDDGSVFVCNCRSNDVVRVRPDRQVERFATSPDFACPNGITRNVDGSLFVVSFESPHVVRVASDGRTQRIATLPGKGKAHVTAISETLFVTDVVANRVYRVEQDGAYEVLAGNGALGFGDGPAETATLARPNGIAATPGGDALWINTLRGEWRGDEVTEIVLRRIDLR